MASVVSRLRECEFDPRKVGPDAWRSRCPAHRGLVHSFWVTRNEFNPVVLTCRSAENCAHMSVIRSLGSADDHLCAETPDWLISQFRRTPVEPEVRAEIEITRNPGTRRLREGSGLVSG